MYGLKEAGEKAFSLISGPEWVQWIHEGTLPAYDNAGKQLNIALSLAMLGKHCSICMNINGCCFPKDNMPDHPLHPNCHCKIMPIYNLVTRAECELSKFTNFIFSDTGNKGKKALFESWGYDIMDSEYLRAEIINQAREKYAKGNFILGLLNNHGQRINIEITLPRKDKMGTVKFISGWMVYPDGLIRNTTPYGGYNERIR